MLQPFVACIFVHSLLLVLHHLSLGSRKDLARRGYGHVRDLRFAGLIGLVQYPRTSRHGMLFRLGLSSCSEQTCMREFIIFEVDSTLFVPMKEK